MYASECYKHQRCRSAAATDVTEDDMQRLENGQRRAAKDVTPLEKGSKYSNYVNAYLEDNSFNILFVFWGCELYDISSNEIASAAR